MTFARNSHMVWGRDLHARERWAFYRAFNAWMPIPALKTNKFAIFHEGKSGRRSPLDNP